MLYRKIYDIGLGNCYILKEKKSNYLIYSEDNSEHFIIAYIINNILYVKEYLKDIDIALKVFNNI